MPVPPKKVVFISHSSLNKQVTEELYQLLTDRYHLTCWMDNFDLQTDQSPFSAQIIAALRGSKLLVQVDSPAARASDYVRREIQTAKDLQIPVQRCSIDERQPTWLRKFKIRWLALTIQSRLARGFILAALALVLLLAALAFGVFFLGTQVVPALANADLRDLPSAFLPTPTSTALPTPSDPKIAAPFHFEADTIIYHDDFNDQAFEGKFNTQTFEYDNKPRDAQVIISQRDGSFIIFFPVDCLREAKDQECGVELDSKVLNASAIQYFGLRARTVDRTSLRSISVSLSINEPDRSRAGFGWNFNDHAMAFFRSIPALPEREFYAYVAIDQGWHAYEILRDPKDSSYHYYVDGQLVDIYTPTHASEWSQAPLRLIIFSVYRGIITGGAQNDTRFEIDEIQVGGFKP